LATIEITYKQIRDLFSKPRARSANKGDFGHVLVIAGSKGMAGAAILCAQGALRAGAGLVTVSVPDELFPIIQTAVPEALCTGRQRISFYPEQLAVYDSIAIGPGLGASRKTWELVMHILENYGGKIVLDADALNVIAGTNVTLDIDTVITPHPGEAARLIGAPVETVQSRREASVAVLAEKFGCTVALKGSGTLVATTNPNLEIHMNITGNPGMATGGSGDVLAGVIAAFLGQGMSAQDAACAGVYMHGFAGDLMANEYGEAGLLAGDLPLGVARAIKYISGTP